MEQAVFYIFGGIAVLGGLVMVSRRNPLDGAVAMVVAMCSLACLYAMLHAGFVFALQILLYAGAIMVLIIFTIMLLNLSRDEMTEPPVGAVKTVIIAAAAGMGLYAFIKAIGSMPLKESFVADSFGNIDKVGDLMLSAYLYPFEIISAVLLAAVVGVVILAKKVI